MQVATLVIAVVGLGLSVLSLGRQAASFLLSGPRVAVSIQEGFRNPVTGGAMIGARGVYADGGATIDRLGYTEHIVAVRVVNSGRLPATVERWGIRFGNHPFYVHRNDPANPVLPLRLEPYSSATWTAAAEFLQQFQEGFTNQRMRAGKIRGEVGIAGRQRDVAGRYSLVVRPDGLLQRGGRVRRLVFRATWPARRLLRP